MKYSSKIKSLAGMLGLAATALLLMACGTSAAPTSAPAAQKVAASASSTAVPKQVIKFSDYNWNSAQLQNRIAMFIVKHGYDYPVDSLFGDTISLWTGLIKGDTHVSMEIWLPNQQEAWAKAMAEGAVVPVGKSLDDNWQSMFVVPTYVVEQNPGLKSVRDLPAYVDLFKTADSRGRARLITCIPGWECEKVNVAKIRAYGLEDIVHLANPGSAAALDSSLKGAYEKGEPWLGYYWGPTKLAAELDLTTLEEPSYSVECWEKDKGCAYPTSEVLIAVHPSMLSRAPDVVEFLGKWDFGAEAQVAAEGYMTEQKTTADRAAIWFLKSYEEVWTRWVPADVAARVKSSLAKTE